MDEQLLSEAQRLAEAVAILRALANPNRLHIFNPLMQGDSCNCELDVPWIYYAVNKEAAQRWQTWFYELLDPGRVQERACLGGPEGQHIESRGVELYDD